jgi:tetratricopeptide (TPR) repeat protein
MARIFLGTTYLDSGNPQAALMTLDTTEFAGSPWLGEAYARSGRRAEALKIANALAAAGGASSPLALARVYLGLGDKERAIEWLTKAFDRREAPVIFARVFPAFDPLRDDPCFRALIARLKMPPSPQ